MRDRAQEAKRIAPKKGPYEIVNKKDGEGSTYVMHLMKGDAVEMLDPVNDLRDVYIFSSMSDGDYVFLRHSAVVSSAKKMGLTLSQMRSEMQKSGDRVRTRLDRLRELECEKITLDPLGKVIYSA